MKNKKTSLKNKKLTKTSITILGSIAILLLLLPVLANIVPDIYYFIKNENCEQIEEYLQSFGMLGAFVAVAIQMVQVFSVVIPAPLIWVSVGAVYGTFWGVIICTTGMVLGNFIVFKLARKFKIRRDEEAEKKRLAFLSGIKSQNLMVVFMIMIPGFPNGIVPYLCAATTIKTTKFLFLVGVACIPAILLTTGIGDLLISGNKTAAMVASSLLLLLAACFLLFKKKIIVLINRLTERQK